MTALTMAQRHWRVTALLLAAIVPDSIRSCRFQRRSAFLSNRSFPAQGLQVYFPFIMLSALLMTVGQAVLVTICRALSANFPGRSGMVPPPPLHFISVQRQLAPQIGSNAVTRSSACRHDPDRIYRAGARPHHFVGFEDKVFQCQWIETWLARPHFQLRFNAEHDAFLMPLNLPLMPAVQALTVVVR